MDDTASVALEAAQRGHSRRRNYRHWLEHFCEFPNESASKRLHSIWLGDDISAQISPPLTARTLLTSAL